MARINELVSPSMDTVIGGIDRGDWERSVDLLVDVGLLAAPVAFDDAVDTGVLDAILMQ